MDVAKFWEIVTQRGYDDFVGAASVAIVFFTVTGLLWRGIFSWVRSRYPDGRGGVAKIGAAVRAPGSMALLALAIQVFFALSPMFRMKYSWIAASRLCSQFLGALMIGEGLFAFFVEYYMQEKRQTDIPAIFKQLFKGTIYLIVALSFLSTIYKIDVTPLLTTSAVFTMVIGLALQDVLGNLFSGLSVHISPPFKIGDWVKVGGFLGKVVESNWRATTLRAVNRDLYVFPNNDVAKKEIFNLGFPEGTIMFDLMIGLPYEVSPERARTALLEATTQAVGISPLRKPRVILETFADSSITYRVRYWMGEDQDWLTVRDSVHSRIWYRLKRDGISIPFPIREVFMHPEKDQISLAIEHRLRLLADIDFLKDLDRPTLAFIAQSLKEFWYQGCETVVKRGCQGTDFFIIDRGSVSVHLDDTLQSRVANLGEGSFFGEMSLLTGEPRSATIVADTELCLLVLGQDVLRHVLEQNPQVAKTLSEALTERQMRNQSLAQAEEERKGKAAASREAERVRVSGALFERIRKFFKLG